MNTRGLDQSARTISGQTDSSSSPIRSIPQSLGSQRQPGRQLDSSYALHRARKQHMQNVSSNTPLPNPSPSAYTSGAQTANNRPPDQPRTQDPVYNARAQQHAARQEEKQQEEQKKQQSQASSSNNLGASMASKASWGSFMWASAIGVWSGVGIISFLGATVASWVSLARTFTGGKSKNPFLPPPIGPSASGMSMGASFLAIHATWILFIFLVIAIATAVYFIVAPYIEAMRWLCSLVNFSDLCLVVQS